MQISEDLIKQITNAVMTEMQRRSEDPCAGSSDCASTAASAPVPSMAGRDRINPEKTDYSGYPKAAQGTDPKEVVIGVGAAFQREIKKTICGIPLDDVLTNVKAGIEEEGMNARVVKILDTSDVCFMALEAEEGVTVEKNANGKYDVTIQIPILKDTLKDVNILYYNKELKIWEIIEPAAVDFEKQTVEFEVEDFSLFAVLANIEEAE